MKKIKTIFHNKTIIALIILFLLAFIVSCSTKEYTIDFETNNASTEIISSQIIKHGDYIIKPDDPQKDGFTFEFWHKTDETNPYDFEDKVYSSFTLEAKWKKIFITLSSPKYFLSDLDFFDSPAYNHYQDYANLLVFEKSFPIPGVGRTHQDGKNYNNMVPQGITVTDEFFLLTAYDYDQEANSTIYVVQKDGAIRATITLPNKAHVGGIAFDGENVWVTGSSKTIHSFKYSFVIDAVNNQLESVLLESFEKDYSLDVTPSFMSYYNNMIWVGSFDVTENQMMHGYLINDKSEIPSLTPQYKIVVPNRVQGVAFTDEGNLIISRSYSRNPTTPNYISELNFFILNWDNINPDNTIDKNEMIPSLIMPPMAEGIVIDNNYLYVNFESAATVYGACPYITDRVIAFNVNSFFTDD